MRSLWIILALVACKKQQEPAPVGQGSGSGSAPPPVAADAQVMDTPAPGPDAAAAAAGPAPVDSDKLLDVEAIGPLTYGLPQAAVIKELGTPKKKTAPEEEGATGEFASTWTYPSLTLDMVSVTRTGAAKVRLITVTAPSTYATKRGIKIGSTRAEVEAAYPKADEGGDDPTQFLVGSQYGGLLFVFKQKDVVGEVVLGPMAF